DCQPGERPAYQAGLEACGDQQPWCNGHDEPHPPEDLLGHSSPRASICGGLPLWFGQVARIAWAKAVAQATYRDGTNGRNRSFFGIARAWAGYPSVRPGAGVTPSIQSLNIIESSKASKDASTMFGETPTVNQRRPALRSRLSIRTRVTASVPPVRIRTLKSASSRSLILGW